MVFGGQVRYSHVRHGKGCIAGHVNEGQLGVGPGHWSIPSAAACRCRVACAKQAKAPGATSMAWRACMAWRAWHGTLAWQVALAWQGALAWHGALGMAR